MYERGKETFAEVAEITEDIVAEAKANWPSRQQPLRQHNGAEGTVAKRQHADGGKIQRQTSRVMIPTAVIAHLQPGDCESDPSQKGSLAALKSQGDQLAACPGIPPLR